MSEENKLDKVLDGFEDHIALAPMINSQGFLVEFSLKGFGFGEWAFYIKDGKFVINTECTDKETIKQAMNILIDQADVIG